MPDSAAIARALLAGAGATVDAMGRPYAGTGFLVSLAGTETVCTPDPGQVAAWVAATLPRLTDGVYLGAWRHDGRVYLDLSEVIPDRETALRVARERAQLAVWDATNEREVLL